MFGVRTFQIVDFENSVRGFWVGGCDSKIMGNSIRF